jgi:hypothetical protein
VAVIALRSILLLCSGLLLACGHMRREGEAHSVRSPDRIERRVPVLVGDVAAPRPMDKVGGVPVHPYMAQHGASCMHVDPFTTNTYTWAGPVGRDPEVESRSMGFLGGECPTINFDSQGRIVSVCVNARKPWLVLIDPNTLQVLARHELPRRRTAMMRMRKASTDTSGGAYFYLDQFDRAVIGTADGNIDVLAAKPTAEGGYEFVLEQRMPLQKQLTLLHGELDKITSVMPDYAGNYWFAARYGNIGMVTPDGVVKALRLDGEEIQNSFSVTPDGVYIVTDHALYRFEVDAVAGPRVVWREVYDRGSHKKIGQVNQGSGTTPTILGDDYVAIGDNAEPRMHVLVFKRDRLEPNRLVCKVPVFEPGASATENTLIGHGRSLIVENNAGYDVFRTMRRGKTSSPGIARIDLREDGSGCDIVWTSTEISQTTVPKMSAANGLIYLYTKLPNAPRRTDAYYFTALDYETGTTVFRVLTGTGVRFDNHWAAISLAPDGSAYIGLLNGLVRVRDRPLPAMARRDP